MPADDYAATQAASATAGWHPVRIPDGDQLGPRRGLPGDRIDHNAMRAWCETACQGAWTVRRTWTSGTHYLFERQADALAFALRFFPFKCT